MLQKAITELKSYLEDKDAPFGVDILIPQIGGGARKTNVSTRALFVKPGAESYDPPQRAYDERSLTSMAAGRLFGRQAA